MSARFNSSVISVKFHANEPNLLLTAEASGKIRIHSLKDNLAVTFIFETEYDKPLMDVDWCYSDARRIAGVASNHIQIWSFGSRFPSTREKITELKAIVRYFRWSLSDKLLMATGYDQVDVFKTDDLNYPIRFDTNTKVQVSGISWFLFTSVCVAAFNDKLHFYYIGGKFK